MRAFELMPRLAFDIREEPFNRTVTPPDRCRIADDLEHNARALLSVELKPLRPLGCAFAKHPGGAGCSAMGAGGERTPETACRLERGVTMKEPAQAATARVRLLDFP